MCWLGEICGKQCLKRFKWLPVGDNLYGEAHDMSPTYRTTSCHCHPDNWTHGHTAENTRGGGGGLACHQCNGDKSMDTTQAMIEKAVILELQ